MEGFLVRDIRNPNNVIFNGIGLPFPHAGKGDSGGGIFKINKRYYGGPILTLVGVLKYNLSILGTI